MTTLVEAYDMVLEDLRRRKAVDERRDQLKALMNSDDDGIVEAVAANLSGKTPDQLKYLGMSLVDAITDILKENGSAMITEKIAEKLVAGGYPKSVSPKTLHTCTAKAAKKGLMVRLGVNLWDLAGSRRASAIDDWHAKTNQALADRSASRQTGTASPSSEAR